MRSQTYNLRRFENHYEIGTQSEGSLTNDVRAEVSKLLQSHQNPPLLEADVGKVVRDVFGGRVQRKKTKHQGNSVYKYFGLKRKRVNDDTAHDSSKRPCSSGLPSTNTNVVDLLEKIRQQTDELESERQQRLNLERQLRELAQQNEMQFTDHQIHVQKIIKNTQDEQSLLKQQLHETRLQSEKELLDLQSQLYLSCLQVSSLRKDLDEGNLVAQMKQQELCQLQRHLEQAQSVNWDGVRDTLDAELVTLRQTKGILSTGPLNPSHRRSVHQFKFETVKDLLMETAPPLTTLLFSIGQYITDPEHTTFPSMTGKDVHSLSALCVLAKKDSPHVNGFQTLVGLMLLARGTSKQVITGLNHIDVSLSYYEILRLVEQTADAIASSNAIQHGTWIVAYDNINFYKHVLHERQGRHHESWNFTSRLATKVLNLPSEELLSTAGIPQCRRSSLNHQDLLPTDEDDEYFIHAARRYVKNLLVHYFRSCNGLLKSSNPRHGQKTNKSVLYPMPLMDIDSSYIDNTVTILDDFQKRLSSDGMTHQCVVGDQATCSTIRGAKRRRVAEFSPRDKLTWAKENPGDFHFQ